MTLDRWLELGVTVAPWVFIAGVFLNDYLTRRQKKLEYELECLRQDRADRYDQLKYQRRFEAINEIRRTRREGL